MPDSDVPTLRQLKIPTALVVGGSPALIHAISKAALSAQVLVAECALTDATTTAAQTRPLVLVMSEDVYAFDPEAFDALARDVRARLLRVEAKTPDADELKDRLVALMEEAERLRPSWTGEL